MDGEEDELFQEPPCLESSGSLSTEVVEQRYPSPEEQVGAQLPLLADVSDNSSDDMVSDSETAADELWLEVLKALKEFGLTGAKLATEAGRESSLLTVVFHHHDNP